MIKLSRQTEQEIIEDAKSRAPQEACGLLVAGKYLPCANIHDDPENHFEIDPVKVVEAKMGGSLQAIIHSHVGPKSPNCPSKMDMHMQAESEVPWGICYVDPLYKPDIFFWGDQLPVAPYKGRVFRHGVADCYALVRDWYRKERKVTLKITPRDPEWWNTGQNVIEECINTLNYFNFSDVPLDAPWEIGDVAIAKVGAQVLNHTGVYVGNNLILHHLANRKSDTDVLTPTLKRMIVKRMRMNLQVQSTAQSEG